MLRDMTRDPFNFKKSMWLLQKHGTGGGTRTRTELSLQSILRAQPQGVCDTCLSVVSEPGVSIAGWQRQRWQNSWLTSS